MIFIFKTSPFDQFSGCCFKNFSLTVLNFFKGLFFMLHSIHISLNIPDRPIDRKSKTKYRKSIKLSILITIKYYDNSRCFV
ncbi:MAG TPA: hypothetical protein DCY53_09410 [Desulfobacteraceae bacterium]|nr:hypothetical protein [Desulfobacteraceae bacterium]